MFLSQPKNVRRMLLLGLMLGGAPAGWAAEPPERFDSGFADVKNFSAGMPAAQFDRLRAVIKPKSGGFDDLQWMTDLSEARKKAAAEGKPLLVWVGDGHPLGWT